MALEKRGPGLVDLRALVHQAVQEFLEAGDERGSPGGTGERTPGRPGCRSRSFRRSLTTRVGTLELRVPQDRDGRFSTELFERYQRSESGLRLIRALAVENHEHWIEATRCWNMDALREMRRERLRSAA